MTNIWVDENNPPTCLHCGAVFSASAGISTDDAPTDGDFTLCFYCKGLCVFTVDALGRMGVRIPQPHEFVELIASDPTITTKAPKMFERLLATGTVTPHHPTPRGV